MSVQLSRDLDSVMAPIKGVVSVSPSDSVNLAGGIARAFYIGGSGNVALVDAAGNTVTITAPAVGVWHPVMVTRIQSTNTTATNILVGY